MPESLREDYTLRAFKFFPNIRTSDSVLNPVRTAVLLGLLLADASRTITRGPETGPEDGTAFDPALSTPSFTLRTMDHQEAVVWINGHRRGATSALWSATLNTAFDPKIPVPEWPPAGAKGCGKASREGSAVELRIQGGYYELDDFTAVRVRHPHLVDGEHVLYVRAIWGGLERTGALRLRVVGKDGALYRWTDYTPPSNADDETAMRFSRTLWFMR
jgi:hypothetical protein